MRNVNEIKAEAKEQIIKLLRMCNCYTFTEEGIDTWLNMWEKSCSPQIEAIAEKSPYYDGKCKIVFPSEYPREIDHYEIRKFTEWLQTCALKNAEPAKINGYTYSEVCKMRNCYYYLNPLMEHREGLYKIFDSETLDALIKEYDSAEFFAKHDLCDETYRNFDYSSFVFYNDEYYSREDLETYGHYRAVKLAQILNNNYAKRQFLDTKLKDVLTRYFPECKFGIGQKLSRAVNQIATKYGFNKCSGWNSVFAKYADAINPLNITKWTVISWHPMDYLTFCFGNSWSTCSNIDKHNVRGVKIGASRSSVTSYVNEDYVFRGEHSAAALSYMFDKTSFIYYTVNHKYDGTHYEEQDKESRIVFSLNEEMDTLLQTRLYPQCNDDNPNDTNYKVPREIVQKVIADALEIPNLWKMKKGREMCCEYARSSGVHYPDYTDERNVNCNISWTGDEPKRIYIGHDAICPNCGCYHDYTGSLNCKDCDPEYDY